MRFGYTYKTDGNNSQDVEFDWTATYYKDNFLRGDHAFKFGMLTRVGDAEVHRLRLPGRLWTCCSTALMARRISPRPSA